MENINNYTKEALNAKHKGKIVIKYNREEKLYGITHISYALSRHILEYLFLPLPLVLLVDAINLGTSVFNYNHYFDTASGEHLGDSRTKAALCANNKGLEFLNQKQFLKAKEWFNKAYQICSESNPSKKLYKNNIGLASAQELQEQKQREQKERAQREQREREQRELQEREQRKQEQRKLYKESEKLWEEAWEAENDKETDRSPEAETKFNQAKAKIDEANKLTKLTTDLDNLNCLKLSQICSHKIEGNKQFNEGFALLQLSNASKKQKIEAYAKLKKAEDEFEQGFNISGDQKFKDCLEFVQKCKIKTHFAIYNIEQLAANLTKLELTHTTSVVAEGNFDAYKDDEIVNFKL